MAEESANPLLLQWIKEWYDKAREQNSKGVFTYKKAYDSMKACPITFDHPSQAQELHGIGPKLCDRLAEKLQEHCRANGEPMPEDPRKAKKKRKSSDNVADDATEVAEEAPKKKTRKTKPKQYVPGLRTGPYAILLALSTLSESSGSGMTKQHLTELAQPHCDSSFTAPSDPSKTYTAWSSMKTLQGKDLVYISGGARKTYTLTDEGWDVAKKIKAVSGLDDSGVANAAQEEDEASGVHVPPAKASHDPPSSQPLPETSGQKARSRPKAPKAVFVDLDDIDEEIGTSAKTSGTKPSQSSRAADEPTLPKKKKNSKLSRSFTDTDCMEILSSSPRLLPEKPPDSRGPLRPAPSHSTNKSRAQDPVPILSPQRPSSARPLSLSPSKAASNSTRSINGGTSDALDIPPFYPIIIPPSEYTIELLLDNREVRSKTDRDYIQSGLLTHGIRPTTRALPVGDALWCARLKSSALLSSHGEEGDEIILDHILERKRLDDLIGSIKDGRFTEQKFRLKKSGAKNVAYLIEDYNLGDDNKTYYHEHMCSAIASTMVVSGFFVKRTRFIDDTIAYLARMTRLLREQYEGKELRIIPSATLDAASSSTASIPLPAFRAALPEPHYITYNAFSNLASKSDTLTLRDVYLKMLMCSKGLTGEKALEIQKIWQTPRELIEAMKGLDEKGKEDLIFKKLGGNMGRRKVGKALSKKVGEVWGGVR